MMLSFSNTFQIVYKTMEYCDIPIYINFDPLEFPVQVFTVGWMERQVGACGNATRCVGGLCFEEEPSLTVVNIRTKAVSSLPLNFLCPCFLLRAHPAKRFPNGGRSIQRRLTRRRLQRCQAKHRGRASFSETPPRRRGCSSAKGRTESDFAENNINDM